MKNILDTNETIVLDFYATWCGTCKATEIFMEELSEEHKNISFYKINIDQNKVLSERYNIMTVPTVIIIKNRKIVKKFIGNFHKKDILMFL